MCYVGCEPQLVSQSQRSTQTRALIRLPAIQNILLKTIHIPGCGS